MHTSTVLYSEQSDARRSRVSAPFRALHPQELLLLDPFLAWVLGIVRDPFSTPPTHCHSVNPSTVLSTRLHTPAGLLGKDSLAGQFLLSAKFFPGQPARKKEAATTLLCTCPCSLGFCNCHLLLCIHSIPAFQTHIPLEFFFC